MAAKLFLLVAFAVALPASGINEEQTFEQATTARQWQDLMTAWQVVQVPQDQAVLATVSEEELERQALQDAEKEIKGLEATSPAKAEEAQHLRATLASTPATAAGPTKAALENAVADMMLGKMDATAKAIAAFGATPFGDSVQKIINLIEKEMFPKVSEGHKINQIELDKLAAAIVKCDDTRKVNVAISDKSKVKYLKFGPLHVTCRQGEAGKSVEKTECYKELSDRKKVMDLKCKEYSMVDSKVGDQNANGQIVKRAGGESTETYVKRLSDTFCPPGGGGPPPGRGGRPTCKKCGDAGCGFEYTFMCAKNACDKATKEYKTLKARCEKIDREYAAKIAQCNNIQDQLDASACKRAVDMKDACETYAECYNEKKKAYKVAEASVKVEERDRKAEWRGLKKMQCLMNAFKDGKVENSEILTCKEQTHSITHLNIKYPVLIKLMVCSVPKEYPITPEYKKAQFAPLPALAKGKEDANECTGLMSIPTVPRAGSPVSCKCERLTLNGPFTPGPVVKCTNCLDTRKSTDKNSCPDGTKVFSPQSRGDWKTFISSAEPLRAPHWIIDVTRPQNGCGGCTGNSMNSGNGAQKSWGTSDGSPWWLRSTKYSEPNGDYHANCYLDLWHKPKNENSVTWNDGSCGYHSKSYYCQLAKMSLKPKPGSPTGCVCENVALTGKYSAKMLIKCKSCLDVRKSTQKNSCPMGTKLFSPASRADWKVFVDSAKPVRSPHWIIDVTRPQNGCGGCTGSPMNVGVAAQRTWGTADGSPWWLRSSRYSEPNGDYHANCYLDLWRTPANENSVTWNDGNCNYHSNSYYCQPVKAKKPVPKPTPPMGPCPDGFEHSKMDITNEKEKIEGKISNEACSKKCTGNSKCVGYEWNGAGDRMCKTKTDYNPSAGKQAKSWTSCIRDKCSAGYTWTKMDLSNENQQKRGAKDTSAQCAKLCDKDGSCRGYEWNALGGRECKTKHGFNAFAGDQSKDWYSCIRGVWKGADDASKTCAAQKKRGMDVKGWELVRRTEGNTFPYSDQLVGSAVSGKIHDNALGKAFASKFDNIKFDQFLFTTGDCSRWMIMNKKDVLGWYANSLRNVVASHTRKTPYKVRMYRRKGSKEDPWITFTHHGSGKNAHCDSLYQENNYNPACTKGDLGSKHKGLNVFIRRAAPKA